MTIDTTDLGSLIGNFDCEYSTEWKFSKSPATLILHEINFSWFQKVKNAISTILEASNFDFWKIFTLENVKTPQKFKFQSCSNGQSGSFWVFKITKIDFTQNLSSRKILKFLHWVFPIRMSGSVFTSTKPIYTLWRIWITVIKQ